MNRADEETKQRRKELIAERQPAQKESATKDNKETKSTEGTSTAHSAQNLTSTVIEVDLSTEDEESSGSHESDFYDSDLDMDDYNGLPGAYYGGYGSCYCCGERGHWSNGCPYNPHRRWP